MRAHQGLRALTAAALVGLVCATATSFGFAQQWDPNVFGKENTLQFLTLGPNEGEHWSRVWVVDIGGRLYIRLGTRAADRIEKNTTAPYVKVRIAGQEFDRVRVEPAPDMAEKVAAAMADKYWSDIFVRHMSHPLTASLVPEARSPASPPRANGGLEIFGINC